MSFASEMADSGEKLSFRCYDAGMKQALGSWRQEGRISLWHYRQPPRMYAGWHFSADKEGCASLLRLLGILSGATGPAHRTLTVTDPRTVRADRIFGDHDLRLDVPAKLRLGNDLDQNGGIGFSADVFTMSLQPKDIVSLSEAVRDISADHADFGVGFGSNNIIVNFWWWPNGR